MLDLSIYLTDSIPLSMRSSLNIIDGFEISTSPDIHISGMYLGDHGIWITVRGSAIVMLWDVKQLKCVLVHDTSSDQTPIAKKVCGQCCDAPSARDENVKDCGDP